MAEESSSAQEDYGLHRAAFHGDVERVKEILESIKSQAQSSANSVAVDVNLPDRHGVF